ncbi:hypothetical protein BT93_A0800 [Corymbia citriodora subsp. variegata]|nr:hypothetical protein BT93_A0800 [Corymbia citriodora subsp. variegata]
MALDNGGKPTAVPESMPISKALSSRVLLTLRMVAFLAMVAATVVMALNKETKTIVVATIGSTPVTATLTAKFQHTPAFVYFVIANGMASLHNLLMIVVEVWGHKFDYKGLRLVMIAVLDMVCVIMFGQSYYQLSH